MSFNHPLSRNDASQQVRRPVASAARRSSGCTRRLQLESLEERVVLTFAAPTIYPVGPNANSLAAADFTGDGILDLATNTAAFVSGSSSYQVAVLAGNDDGSFQPAQLTPNPGGSLVAGDLNGDGQADLVVVNSTSLNVLISNGNGTFQPAQPVTLPPQTLNDPAYTGGPLPQQPLAAVVGDLNADGHVDLVATGTTTHTIVTGPGSYGGYYEYNVTSKYVNVLLGTGTGTFGPAATNFFDNNSSSFSTGPDVADFNGDGQLDLLMSRAFWSGPLVYSALWAQLGNGDGTFQAARITDTYSGSHFLHHAVADFNQDGRTDVLMGGAEYATATVALGNTDGTFTPLNPFDIGQIPSHDVVDREVGDVDGDGKMDLVFIKKLYENRWADVLLGKGDGTFAKPVTYDLSALAYASAKLADFDGDGLADLAAVDRNVGVIVHKSTGAASSFDLQIGDASVAEGNSGTTNLSFTVTLSQAATEPVTVQFATAGGTAAAGSDYQSASGTITFAPGDTEQTINIAVLGDESFESDETFTVNLSNPSGGLIANSQAVGVIRNDDTLPAIRVSDATVIEGNSGTQVMNFTVSLSQASGEGVWVNYKTANGNAKATDDYSGQSGTLYFAPGETSKSIEIVIFGDTRKEQDERFYVNLSGVIGATLGDSQATGTILNNDGGSAGGKRTSSAAAVDAAIDDWMVSRRKQRK